jgi:hypothetical protein
LFATVTGAVSCADLNASVGASGPRDFAVRFRAVRHQRQSVHRIPPHVRDDRETPLIWDGTADDMQLIWVRREAENFFVWDWTTQITLIRFNKFSPARNGRGLGCMSGNARKLLR